MPRYTLTYGPASAPAENEQPLSAHIERGQALRLARAYANDGYAVKLVATDSEGTQTVVFAATATEI